MSGMNSTKVRVLLVDDHPMIRQGLADLINDEPNMEICGEAGTCREGLELIATLKPNLAIIDISLGDGDGIVLIKDIRARSPQVHLLVLSMHDELVYAQRAIRAGAAGYVMKAEAAETVMAAIRCILAGKIYISVKVTNQMLRSIRAGYTADQSGKAPIERLTDRELQLLRLLGAGLKVREISRQLFISSKTVESHRVNIKRKLSLDTSAELLRFAIQYSRIEP
jgi:DNA-binding NarL/FixJ family response regulator